MINGLIGLRAKCGSLTTEYNLNHIVILVSLTVYLLIKVYRALCMRGLRVQGFSASSSGVVGLGFGDLGSVTWGVVRGSGI